MKRIEFLRKSLMGTGILVAGGATAIRNQNDELEPLEVVGFNHLPNVKTENMENTIIHRADSRGQADHGWLKTHLSFSFANYYNPDRMHFGVLRVLNDDTIAPGMGFSTHPHDNMEIITIPLEGAVEHKDSMGNSGVIQTGQVQVMSAGTGIYHSEFNHYKDGELKLFQIWLFPREQQVTPRYDQIDLPVLKKNDLVQILSPDPSDAGVWIHQDAWFYLGDFDAGGEKTYTIKRPGNGVYCMVVEGSITMAGQKLDKRDAMGIWDVNEFTLTADSAARVLLMDIPMAMN